MKFKSRSQQGQALVELALVVFLFSLFAIGLLQLVMFGAAYLQAQQVSRRAAWLHHRFRTAPLQDQQIQQLLPGCQIEKISGTRLSQPWTIRITYHVPAIGCFKFLQPQGFTITTQSCVLANIERPLNPTTTSSQKLWDRIQTWYQQALQ